MGLCCLWISLSKIFPLASFFSKPHYWLNQSSQETMMNSFHNHLPLWQTKNANFWLEKATKILSFFAFMLFCHNIGVGKNQINFSFFIVQYVKKSGVICVDFWFWKTKSCWNPSEILIVLMYKIVGYTSCVRLIYVDIQAA